MARVVTAHILVEVEDGDEAIDIVQSLLFSAEEEHIPNGELIRDWTTGRLEDWSRNDVERANAW